MKELQYWIILIILMALCALAAGQPGGAVDYNLCHMGNPTADCEAYYAGRW